jgi:hypothetical protein
MTTLDSVVQLNADRSALQSAKAHGVEKELLLLLRSAPKHFQSKTPVPAKQLFTRQLSFQFSSNPSLSRIYRDLSVSSKASLERLREVLRHYGRKYAVGFGVRTEKDEVWLDWFTEIGVDLAYVAEGYSSPSNHSDVQAMATTAISKLSKNDDYPDLTPNSHLIPPLNSSFPIKPTNNARLRKETKSSTQSLNRLQSRTLLSIEQEPNT